MNAICLYTALKVGEILQHVDLLNSRPTCLYFVVYLQTAMFIGICQRGQSWLSDTYILRQHVLDKCCARAEWPPKANRASAAIVHPLHNMPISQNGRHIWWLLNGQRKWITSRIDSNTSKACDWGLSTCDECTSKGQWYCRRLMISSDTPVGILPSMEEKDVILAIVRTCRASVPYV